MWVTAGDLAVFFGWRFNFFNQIHFGVKLPNHAKILIMILFEPAIKKDRAIMQWDACCNNVWSVCIIFTLCHSGIGFHPWICHSGSELLAIPESILGSLAGTGLGVSYLGTISGFFVGGTRQPSAGCTFGVSLVKWTGVVEHISLVKSVELITYMARPPLCPWEKSEYCKNHPWATTTRFFYILCIS